MAIFRVLAFLCWAASANQCQGMVCPMGAESCVPDATAFLQLTLDTYEQNVITKGQRHTSGSTGEHSGGWQLTSVISSHGAESVGPLPGRTSPEPSTATSTTRLNLASTSESPVDEAVETAEDAVDEAVEAAEDAVDTAAADTATEAADNVTEIVEDPAEDVEDIAEDTAEDLEEGVEEAEEAVEEAVDDVEDVADDALDSLGFAAKDASKKTASAASALDELSKAVDNVLRPSEQQKTIALAGPLPDEAVEAAEEAVDTAEGEAEAAADTATEAADIITESVADPVADVEHIADGTANDAEEHVKKAKEVYVEAVVDEILNSMEFAAKDASQRAAYAVDTLSKAVQDAWEGPLPGR